MLGHQAFPATWALSFFLWPNFGPPDLSQWRAEIERAKEMKGAWQFATVQFNNAAFLCITLNDVGIKIDRVLSPDLENLHKTVSLGSSY